MRLDDSVWVFFDRQMFLLLFSTDLYSFGVLLKPRCRPYQTKGLRIVSPIMVCKYVGMLLLVCYLSRRLVVSRFSIKMEEGLPIRPFSVKWKGHLCLGDLGLFG